MTPIHLYDMEAGPGERNNLGTKRPDVVDRLVGVLEHTVAHGRSTPGPSRTNDVPVDIWKGSNEADTCDA